MQDEIVQVIGSLKKGLNQYKAMRPALSWRAIAKQSGVNRYFLKKILDDEPAVVASKKHLDFTQALVLAKYLSDRGEKTSLKDSIDSADQPLQTSFKQNFKVLYDSESSKKDIAFMEMEDALNFHAFCILVLAHRPKGFPQEHLTRILGEKSLYVLEVLIEKEKVKLENGFIVLVEDVYMHISAEIRKMHILNFVTNFLQVSSYPSRNYSHIQVNYLNSKALAKLQSLHENFHRKVAELMEKVESHGEYPVFSVAAMDTLLPFHNP